MGDSIAQSLMVASAETAQPQQFNWTQDDLDALKASTCKDLSLPEFKVFILNAMRLGLDPFAKQIYAWKDGGKMTTQVSIDGMRSLAERTGKYGGQLGPLWCGDDGVWTDMWIAKTPPVACKVGIIRAGFKEPMWGFARFASYNKGNAIWNKYPEVMIAKVAESLGLRRTFPQVLGGVYIPEEFAGASDATYVDADVDADVAPSVMVTEEITTRPTPMKKGYATLPAVRELPAAAESTSSMTVNEFCRKVRDHLTLTPKEAMVALGVKSLTGIDLEAAYKTLEQQLRRGEESQEEPAEIAAGCNLRHSTSRRTGWDTA